VRVGVIAAGIVVAFALGLAIRSVHPATRLASPAPVARPLRVPSSSTAPEAAAAGRLQGFPSYAAVAKTTTIAAHASPGTASPIVASFPARDNDGAPMTFLVKGEQRGGDATTWYRVLLPIRPNGASGWVADSDVDIVGLPYRLVVHLTDFRIDLVGDGPQAKSFTIGVGTDATPTPGGEYYVTALVQPPNPNTAYGAFVLELNGHSPIVHGAFADGLLGIHGTNDPAHALGRKVSHGCIRMRDEDIGYLARLLPLGTPVDVV
jgi:lipoprotein-anchoring transpeptidase ErfK/SrfK